MSTVKTASRHPPLSTTGKRPPALRMIEPWWGMLLLGLGLGVLILLFPNQSRLSTLFQRTPSSQNSVELLQHWLRENPNDSASRLTLAQKSWDSYDPKPAIAVLNPLIETPPPDHADHLVYWSALTLLYQAHDQLLANGESPLNPLPGLNRHNARHPDLPWTLRLRLAEAAFAHEAPTSGQWMLSPEYVLTPTRSISELQAAIAVLQRYGFHRQATAFALHAFTLTPDASTWETVLDALLQSPQLDAARAFYAATPISIRETERFQYRRITDTARLMPDKLTPQLIQQWLQLAPPTSQLQAALHVTLSLGRLEQAEQLGQEWLQRDPTNAEALERLHDVFRWQNKLKPALRLSEKRLALKPEQHSQQHKAQQHRAQQHKAQHPILNSALEEAWALSDYKSLGRLYQLALQRGWLTEQNAPQVIHVFDHTLTPDQNQRAVTRLFRAFPHSTLVTQHYFQLLANHGDIETLATRWSTLTPDQRQVPVALRTRLANVAYHHQQTQLALTLLTQDLIWREVTDLSYLHTVQLVAQQLGASETAEAAAYRKYELSGDAMSYYTTLLVTQDSTTLSTDFFIRKYHNTADASLLVLAAHHAHSTHNDELLAEAVRTAQTDHVLDESPDLWLYTAQLYTQRQNPNAAAEALAKASRSIPRDPERQYLQFSHALSLNLTDEIARLFEHHHQSPDTVPTTLHALMAEAADRLNRPHAAIYWYQRLLDENRRAQWAQQSWPVYRLAVLYARVGLVDRSHQLKHYLLEQLTTPGSDDWSEMSMALLDSLVGQQFSTRHLQQHLQQQMQEHPQQTPQHAHETASDNRRTSQASDKPLHQTYVQLVDRLLQNYDYYAASQWRNLGLSRSNPLNLEPWQNLALAEVNPTVDTSDLLSTPGLNRHHGAHYHALLLAEHPHQAWLYGSAQLKTPAPKRTRSLTKRPTHDTASDPSVDSDHAYLRALYLTQYDAQAPFWSTHWRINTHRDTEAGQTFSAFWQYPAPFGAWYFGLESEEAPSHTDHLAQFTDPERTSRQLTIGQRWLMGKQRLETVLTRQSVLGDSFWGARLFATGTAQYGNTRNTWQFESQWRAPSEYNDQVDFLTRRNSMGFSVHTQHNDLIATIFGGRYDHIESIFADALGNATTQHGEINSDFLRGDNILQAYLTWYQYDFSDPESTDPLPIASQRLGYPLYTSDLFLHDAEQTSVGLRWGLRGIHPFSHPVEHLLDVRIGYEGHTHRTGLSISDWWRWRIGPQRYLEVNYGFSALTPLMSQSQWFELGFKQLME
ncbi:MAG: tetratricopeptide repeat protein [Gammaproteobacteria bacterium]